MPTSPMLDMGPCELYWGFGDPSEVVALGRTLGGVKLNMETHTADILEDQAGDAAVNAVLTGSVMSVEATLTRLSVDELATILNTTKGTNNSVPIENQVGCDLYDLARPLLIVPLCGNDADTNTDHWVVLHKTYPVTGLELVYDKDTQRTFPVTFKVFVKQESPYAGKFGAIGLWTSVSIHESVPGI